MNYLLLKIICVYFFITRTLFPVVSRRYFRLVFLNKPQHFDTVLLLVYMVSKLVYPNCTHTQNRSLLLLLQNERGHYLHKFL